MQEGVALCFAAQYLPVLINYDNKFITYKCSNHLVVEFNFNGTTLF